MFSIPHYGRGFVSGECGAMGDGERIMVGGIVGLSNVYLCSACLEPMLGVFLIIDL